MMQRKLSGNCKSNRLQQRGQKPRQRLRKRMRGRAWVVFDRVEDANAAKVALSGMPFISDRRLKIDYAESVASGVFWKFRVELSLWCIRRKNHR